MKSTGIISTIAGDGQKGSSGDGGLAYEAKLHGPMCVAIDANDDIFICDTHNHKIRKVNVNDGKIITFAGTGVAGYSGIIHFTFYFRAFIYLIAPFRLMSSFIHYHFPLF